MLMNEQYTFNATTHSNFVKFIPHTLKSCWYRWIFLEQWLFRSKCIVCQRISMINEYLQTSTLALLLNNNFPLFDYIKLSLFTFKFEEFTYSPIFWFQINTGYSVFIYNVYYIKLWITACYIFSFFH